MVMKVKDVQRILDGTVTRGEALFHIVDKERERQLSPEQRRLVRAVWDAPKPEKVSVPEHPESRARRHAKTREDSADLSQADLVWLQRLPQDPNAVTFEDAVALASLAMTVKASDAPASARLIQSIWQPVKALHDKRVAEAQLERARADVPPSMPAGAEAALNDALHDEYPGLHDSAYLAQATVIAQEAQADRRYRHERAVATAQQHLDEATAAVTQHTQTERQTVA